MCCVERGGVRTALRKKHLSFVTTQLIIYLFVSLTFLGIAALCLNTVTLHFFQTTQSLEGDLDLMMALDSMRYDFWYKSICVAQVSMNALSFKEKIDGKEKSVWYRIDIEDGNYVLKRVANDGVNVIYSSKEPVSFYEAEGIWGVRVGSLCFEMLNATPSSVREKLGLKTGELPPFLTPRYFGCTSE